MTEGFSNPILGGAGALIRSQMQSPNYSPGSAGWIIKRDGSAEFNNVTVRGQVVITSVGQSLLVYNGTPAAGNLLVSISPTTGTDQFGNAIYNGITIQKQPAAYGDNGIITFEDDTGTIVAVINVSNNVGSLFYREPVFSSSKRLILATNGQDVVINNANLSFISGGRQITAGTIIADTALNVTGTSKFGSGRIGQYYSVWGTWSRSAVPNATQTALGQAALSFGQEDSDYSGVWAGGVLTTPGNWWVDAMLTINGIAGAARITATIWRNGVLIAENSETNGAASAACATANAIYSPTGTHWQYAIYQNSGAAADMTGYFSLARRL